MNILLSIAILLFCSPIFAETASEPVALQEAQLPQEDIASQIAENEQTEQEPKRVARVSKTVNKKQRDRRVLDLVLAGVVAVGTFIAILLI